MISMRKLALLTGLLSITFFAKSQQIVPCATDELFVESVKAHPELKMEEEKANASVRAANQVILRKAGTVIYFPVVFHVIHKYGFENISQAQINDAIRVLNEDFRKVAGTNGGSSTDPLATDMQYEFRLAQFDPNGNPTNGVNRIYSVKTDNAYDTEKALSRWDSKRYYNIWIVNTIQNSNPSSTILGYAQFPYQINSQPNTDGVMLRSDQAGVIEMGSTSQQGRTLTHESGHWVGLYHPFQGGCVGGTASTCASQGDQVCDTPPVATSTNGCPTGRNSCTNDVPELPDQVKNYMDYADGTCMNLFTVGQKARTDNMVVAYRSIAFSASNLSSVGLNTNGTYKTLTASSIKAPYSFGFDVTSLTGTGWNIENYMSPGDSGWALNKAAFVGGNGCISSQNLKNYRLNIRNAFVSPSIDITSLTNPTLTFYVAYAKKLTVSNDKLKIFVSNSFGRNDSLVKTFLPADMETGSMSTVSFTPGAGEWRKLTLDLSAFKSYTNCRIRIELQSLRGNNIYVDEFMISEPVGLSDVLKQKMQFSFYPNPVHHQAYISFQNEQNQEIEMEIFDMNGKLVKQIEKQNYLTGAQNIEIPLENYQVGLYLLQVKTGNGSFTHRFLVD